MKNTPSKTPTLTKGDTVVFLYVRPMEIWEGIRGTLGDKIEAWDMWEVMAGKHKLYLSEWQFRKVEATP